MTPLAPLIPLAYAVPYALRVRTLRRAGRPVAAWRIACFGGGLLLLAVAIAPPLADAADERLTAHMAEHLLIGDLAPLLIVLGCSGPVLAPLLRTGAAARLRPLAHPVPALLLWLLGLYAWHLPAAYDGALRSEPLHVLQHSCFFVLGANMWAALLGPLPKPAWFGPPARLGYMLSVWLGGALLGAALVFSGTAFYDVYAGREGAGALGDQSAAGAIMMVEGAVVAFCMFCWLFGVIWREAAQRQELAELAAAGGIALDERRIARAVSAGQADALRRRILATTPADREPVP